LSFEDVYKFESLMKSAHDCELGVRWKASTQSFEINQLRWCADLSNRIKSGTYKSKGFNEFYINERGKVRFIQSVHISERCVQKSLVNNVLRPAILPRLIYDNSASLKGKGTEFALKRLKCHLQRHYRKYGTKGGILIIDFKNYFGSINHDKLLEMLKPILPDNESYRLTEQFVRAFGGDYGLGLGSEISQTCAIFYPNKIDHYIKEKLHIQGYGRYMDDSYLISDNVEYLKQCLNVIRDMCQDIDITINEHRTQIIKFKGGNFIYLKKRIKLCESGAVIMRLTRKNITKRRRKLKLFKDKLGRNEIKIDSIIQSYNSWRGYAKKYNTKQTLRSMNQLFAELFTEELYGY